MLRRGRRRLHAFAEASDQEEAGEAGAQGGLGWYINTARYYLQTSQIFAGLVVISVLGIAVEGVFAAIEARTVVRWGKKR